MNIQDVEQLLISVFIIVVTVVATNCLLDIRAGIKRIEKHLGIKKDNQ